MEISDEAISDLAESIDTNHDGSIDIEEFMGAFRLVGKNRLERGRSVFAAPVDEPPEDGSWCGEGSDITGPYEQPAAIFSEAYTSVHIFTNSPACDL